jgi:hypothetical protein
MADNRRTFAARKDAQKRSNQNCRQFFFHIFNSKAT